MKKLSKRIRTTNETVQAYAWWCRFGCPSRCTMWANCALGDDIDKVSKYNAIIFDGNSAVSAGD